MNHLLVHARLGTVILSWNSEGKIQRVDWSSRPGSGQFTHPALVRSASWSALARGEIPGRVAAISGRLQSYFERGEPLGAIPWDALDLSEMSEFQQKVYRALDQVPHGETRTYAWIASRIKSHGASRAVGQALRRNPMPLIIPCHRVVSTTAIGGFMGTDNPDHAELQLKRALLDLEQSYCNPMFSFLQPLWGGMPALTGAAG
jgi:methylated-DNA-[protein]-cysteine S-methyltransferase